MMKEKINDYVNRAQLAINDWQCNGELYYLAQAKAYLDVAETLTAIAQQPGSESEPAPLYNAECFSADFDTDLHDTPEEALAALNPQDLVNGEIFDIVKWRESEFRPHIDMEDLLDDFITQADDAGGEGAEPYTEYLAGQELKAARTDLERQLNEVLNRWLDKHHVDAGWYNRCGVVAKYKFDGTKFVRVDGGADEP